MRPSFIARFALLASFGLLKACNFAPMKDWERLAHSLVEQGRSSDLSVQDVKNSVGGRIEFTFLSRRTPDAIRESSQAICRAQDWRSGVTQAGVECHRMSGHASISIRPVSDGLVAVTVAASGD